MSLEARRIAGLLAVCCTALLAPVAHAAGGDRGSWELGVYGGYGLLDDYAGLDPDDDVLFGGRLGYFITPGWSAEVSYQTLGTETGTALPLDLDLSSYRFNALYNFRRGASFRPFITFGLGQETTETTGLDTDDEGANVGAGLRWFLGDHFGFRLDARYVYANVGDVIDEAQSNIETTAGILFSFGGGPPPDEDGDGVRDKRDACPGTPRGAVVDEEGCPQDSDGDKVYDGLDRCPDTPSGCPVDDQGCPLDLDGDGVIDCRDKCPGTVKSCPVGPDGCPKDEDGDGVCDGADKCPGTPKGCSVGPDGCPKDEDGDGVCDGADKCPGTPKGCSVGPDGCPQDEDRDGVCDGLDRCAGTPAGRKVDPKGCELAFDERGKLVLEGVRFALDSAKLTPDSTAVLDRVAASLKEWPDIRVEIAGHTDASGSAAHNQRLSQRRAEAVRDYLVGRGLDASRFVAKGYGETQPVADNTTEAGRAHNRRTELVKIN